MVAFLMILGVCMIIPAILFIWPLIIKGGCVYRIIPRVSKDFNYTDVDQKDSEESPSTESKKLS